MEIFGFESEIIDVNSPEFVVPQDTQHLLSKCKLRFKPSGCFVFVSGASIAQSDGMYREVEELKETNDADDENNSDNESMEAGEGHERVEEDSKEKEQDGEAEKQVGKRKWPIFVKSDASTITNSIWPDESLKRWCLSHTEVKESETEDYTLDEEVIQKARESNMIYFSSSKADSLSKRPEVDGWKHR